MKIATTTGLVGFLLALSAFNISQAEAKTYDSGETSIEQRLARISATIREQETNLPESTQLDLETEIAGGWGNGRGRGWGDGRSSSGWANGRYGSGWGNGRNGSWINGRNWRDGGSFWNRR